MPRKIKRINFDSLFVDLVRLSTCDLEEFCCSGGTVVLATLDDDDSLIAWNHACGKSSLNAEEDVVSCDDFGDNFCGHEGVDGADCVIFEFVDEGDEA